MTNYNYNYHNYNYRNYHYNYANYHFSSLELKYDIRPNSRSEGKGFLATTISHYDSFFL